MNAQLGRITRFARISRPILVGTSGGATSNEVVTLANPAAGTYKVCVVGYAPQNDSSNYTLSSWVVSPADVGGNLKVMMPSTVYTGGTATAAASWSGLTVGKRYMGAIQYVVSGVNQGMTLLSVDATDPLPLAEGQQAKVNAKRVD